MLDAYVIDEIKRRDRGQRRDDRPVVELPVPPPRPERAPSHEKEDDDGRPGGVVIIDYS